VFRERLTVRQIDAAVKQPRDIAFWPQAEMPTAPINTRFLGKADIALA
jgi:hypothetical protein